MKPNALARQQLPVLSLPLCPGMKSSSKQEEMKTIEEKRREGDYRENKGD